MLMSEKQKIIKIEIYEDCDEVWVTKGVDFFATYTFNWLLDDHLKHQQQIKTMATGLGSSSEINKLIKERFIEFEQYVKDWELIKQTVPSDFPDFAKNNEICAWKKPFRIQRLPEW